MMKGVFIIAILLNFSKKPGYINIVVFQISGGAYDNK
jgi:hypothetical protein